MKIIEMLRQLLSLKKQIPVGRPKGVKNKHHPKQDAVTAWRRDNPQGTKSDCARALNITRKTVAKYWN